MARTMAAVCVLSARWNVVQQRVHDGYSDGHSGADETAEESKDSVVYFRALTIGTLMEYHTVQDGSGRIMVIAACIYRPFLEHPDHNPAHDSWVSRYLLAKRPYSGKSGGLWEMPGGKVHHGETLYEGLVRELDEELGFGDSVPDTLEILYKVDVDFSYGNYRVVFARVDLSYEEKPSNVPLLIEHIGLVWWNHSELHDMANAGLLTPATEAMVKFMIQTL